MSHLTPNEIQHYREEGYVVPEFRLLHPHLPRALGLLETRPEKAIY